MRSCSKWGAGVFDPRKIPGVSRAEGFESACFAIEARSARQPWLGGVAGGLEGGDLVAHLQGDADFVEAVQQAVFAERVDLELEAVLERRGDDLIFKVDGD